jgi:hypothetical protein
VSEFRIPSHVGKTPAEILAIEQLDAGGHLYKSMAWLNYFERVPVFSPLLYACIDARYGIEYLLFEELVISTGANLSQADYQRCTGERNRFIKTIEQLTPDYLLLKRFTRLVASLEPRAPKLIDWNLKGLMRDWGEMSHFLHWVGARGLTTEDTAWLVAAHEKIVATVKPIWINLTSGRSAMLHPKDMHPIAMGVWEEFKRGEINEATVKFQLTVLRPAGA